MIDIEAMKKRCEAATAGPWASDFCGDVISESVLDDSPEIINAMGEPIFMTLGSTTMAGEQPRRDAEFIAAARMDLPSAIEAIEKMRKVLEFYSNGAHWSTRDDEYEFTHVSEKDWDKNENGYFVGGKHARAVLKEVFGEENRQPKGTK